MPGDVVRRMIPGKDTQRGYARAVRVSAVVQTIGSKVVIPNVLASNLTPVQVTDS
jgi:ubiquitin-conjugating enzyme E2 O